MRTMMLVLALSLGGVAHSQVPGHMSAGSGGGVSAGSVGAGPAPLVAATPQAARAEASGLTDITRGAAEHTADAATATVPMQRTVRVRAGTHVRVARDTRCTDGTNAWDPARGTSGHYYCTTAGPGLAAETAASVRR